jgi:hypothetical protein
MKGWLFLGQGSFGRRLGCPRTSAITNAHSMSDTFEAISPWKSMM